jgi:hypothetical protein
MELRYFRDDQRREVDFIILRDRKPEHFIEAKTHAREIDPSLRYLKGKFPGVRATQVVLEGARPYTTDDGISVEPAHAFLAGLA